MLLDIYARADITNLCKGNAYNRLQWEDVTVRLAGQQQQHGGRYICRSLRHHTCLQGTQDVLSIDMSYPHGPHASRLPEGHMA